MHLCFLLFASIFRCLLSQRLLCAAGRVWDKQSGGRRFHNFLFIAAAEGKTKHRSAGGGCHSAAAFMWSNS